MVWPLSRVWNLDDRISMLLTEFTFKVLASFIIKTPWRRVRGTNGRGFDR